MTGLDAKTIEALRAWCANDAEDDGDYITTENVRKILVPRLLAAHVRLSVAVNAVEGLPDHPWIPGAAFRDPTVREAFGLPASCFCDRPGRIGVAHRSHECVVIGVPEVQVLK